MVCKGKELRYYINKKNLNISKHRYNYFRNPSADIIMFAIQA